MTPLQWRLCAQAGQGSAQSALGAHGVGEALDVCVVVSFYYLDCEYVYSWQALRWLDSPMKCSSSRPLLNHPQPLKEML